MKEISVSLFLNDWCMDALAELSALRNTVRVASGQESVWTPESVLANVIMRNVNGLVHKDIAAYRGVLENITSGKPPLKCDGEAGDVPTRNPAPAMEEVAVTLELDEGQQRRLDKFAALRRKGEVVPRPENCYTHKATLQYILRVVSFDAILDEATAWEEELLKSRKAAVSEFWDFEPSDDDEAAPDEAGDVPARNPAPDEEPETLVSVRDASGVVREVTLDEAEAMREAAQGIYEGAPPEPQMDDNSEVYFALLEASRV